MAEPKDREVHKAPKDASEGTPIQTTTPKYEKPGPDVSNADVDMTALSLDAAFSKNVPNPDPNPDELVPAPGPSSIEVHGVAEETDEPANNPMEETR